MKILAVADEESKSLWDYYEPEKLGGAEILISCGDLNKQYVNYLATMSGKPLLFVHGNHDDNYDEGSPCGGVCLDDETYCYRGVRFAGLGGSIRYNNGVWQFTEGEMRRRVRKLCAKIDKMGGVDVFITHAPLRGCGDFEDLPHRGFEAFRPLLERYSPAVMVHGHIHTRYAPNLLRERQYGSTRVINACERFFFELPDGGPDAAPPHRQLFERFRLSKG